ncbi:RagB/SusD family nutrient uptake outer membrane protein [Parafilimonas sp.]|uniref:RagB/SusD family nutrient uptake outer membrane protein n=1 Tax=Parafilimonas sp. TaxID=1969739 RepID=UPI0039E35645
MKQYLIYIPAFILTLTSCNKFLNDTPKTSETTGNAYSTADDAEKALLGCYNTFYSSDYYQWENVMLSDVRSDNAYPGGYNEETFYDYDRFILPASNTHNYANWTALYNGIARCNILLNKIGGISDTALTDERRQQIIGEASFLRAFHYYQLVKLFGGVPLELESNTADPAVTRKARATETEVYDQIVADLQTAADDLPDTYSGAADDTYTANTAATNKSRATKGAVNALLAKVWAQRSDRDYSKVLDYCNEVINSAAGYALQGSFAELFDGDHYFNDESILEVPFESGSSTAGNWGVELYLAPEDGWQKYCVPSKNLVSAYEAEGDTIRENASIIFMDRDANGDPISWADENWNPCQDEDTPIPFNYKQKHPDDWASGDHYYLLRLADIILLKAEAQNELGSTEDAIETLNLIRARVNLKAISTSITQAEARDYILNERRLEMAFEADRWDALVRAGVASTVMQSLSEYYYTCADGTQSSAIKMDYSNCTEDHWINPIPLIEMGANPNLVQNDGY